MDIVVTQSAESGLWAAVWAWTAGKLLPPLIAGAVLALLGSWLLARLNETHKGKREHLSKTVDQILATLRDLQKLSAEYWSKPAFRSSKSVEAEIEYLIDLLNVLLAACSEDIWPGQPERPTDLWARLAGIISNHDFATPGRRAEAGRGRTIASACKSIADEVIRGRRHIVHQGVWHRLSVWMSTAVSNAERWAR